MSEAKNATTAQELLDKITREARERRPEPEPEPLRACAATAVGQPAAGYGASEALYAQHGPVSLPEDVEERRDYSLDELTRFHGRQFLQNAYHALLKRSPDPSGVDHFLTKLQQGQITKIEILGRLRYSPEGRKAGVLVRGLAVPFAVQTACRTPVAGYFLRAGLSLLQAPRYLRSLLSVEATANTRIDELAAAHNQLLPTLQALVDENTRLREQLNGMEEGAKERASGLVSLSKRIDTLQMTDITSLYDQMLHVRSREIPDLYGKLYSIIDKDVPALNSKLDEQYAQLTETANNLESKYAAAQQAVNANSQMLHDHKLMLIEQQQRLRLLLTEARNRMPEPFDAEQLQTLSGERQDLLDAMYLSLEDRFRGTRQEIKRRQAMYLTVVERAMVGCTGKRIVDIGCGRGEWLELCKEQGFDAMGVDLNVSMVEECRERGLQTEHMDGLEYLKQLEPGSLCVLTSFHMVEHLDNETMVEFVDLAYRALEPGGLLILETPNPRNILVGAGDFYRDPTHRNPIFPETLEFIVLYRGFQESTAYFHSSGRQPELIPAKDQDFRSLEDYLTVSRDYSLVGSK